jgi:transcriptional regulator with XRE-family HTH domain
MKPKRKLSPLAKRIRELRLGGGLTQDALAEAAGISRQQIQNLEVGRSENPSASTLHKLAKALGIEAAELISA